ncbi:hypothetical protein KSF78_0003138 [Schistosoma japonicum]|nr:hypothetical protein KSF78_0003138 [Schistosoma japonicum]KAH8865151.1 hypothetical protein KSF78_0003138 [Schistosoma japonicum]
MNREHAEKQLVKYDTNKDAKSLKNERSRFNFADKDCDGLLSLEEFTLFLRPENYEDMANYELQKSFSSFDQNGDGVVTYDEFTNFSYRALKAAAKSEATWLMNLTDSNHDGQLTLDEILAKSHSWKDSQVVKHARSLWDEL